MDSKDAVQDNTNLSKTGQEMFLRVTKHEFAKTFPDMRYVNIEEAYGGFPVACVSFLPSGEVKEGDNSFVIQVALSGAREKDISIKIKPGVLELRCARTFGAHNIAFGMMVITNRIKTSDVFRTYPIPASLDISKVNAKLANGVLSIGFPKRISEEVVNIEVCNDPSGVIPDDIAIIEEGGNENE